LDLLVWDRDLARNWSLITIASVEDFPSPFTRIGPGVNNMIKPDLVGRGGDLTLENGSGPVIDPSMGVITTEKDFRTEGLFTSESGTSISAAEISHLAAKLRRDFPDATSNLIKALLTASAKIPEFRPSPLDKLNLKSGSAQDLSSLLNIYGHGRPSFGKAFSIRNRVLLIDESELNPDEITVYEIPVPEVFYSGGGRRAISVILAFDPPTRPKRKEYIGTTMEFHLFGDVDVEQITQKYAKMVDSDAEDECSSEGLNQLDHNEINLVPGINLARKRTIQKRMWIIDGDSKRRYDSLKLVVTCKNKWLEYEDYKQRYAVVVTIEQREMVELYNEIEAKINAQIRVPLRTKIHTS